MNHKFNLVQSGIVTWRMQGESAKLPQMDEGRKLVLGIMQRFLPQGSWHNMTAGSGAGLRLYRVPNSV
jgi:hypothetical protein